MPRLTKLSDAGNESGQAHQNENSSSIHESPDISFVGELDVLESDEEISTFHLLNQILEETIKQLS